MNTKTKNEVREHSQRKRAGEIICFNLRKSVDEFLTEAWIYN